MCSAVALQVEHFLILVVLYVQCLGALRFSVPGQIGGLVYLCKMKKGSTNSAFCVY